MPRNWHYHEPFVAAWTCGECYPATTDTTWWMETQHTLRWRQELQWRNIEGSSWAVLKAQAFPEWGEGSTPTHHLQRYWQATIAITIMTQDTHTSYVLQEGMSNGKSTGSVRACTSVVSYMPSLLPWFNREWDIINAIEPGKEVTLNIRDVKNEKKNQLYEGMMVPVATIYVSDTRLRLCNTLCWRNRLGRVPWLIYIGSAKSIAVITLHALCCMPRQVLHRLITEYPYGKKVPQVSDVIA